MNAKQLQEIKDAKKKIAEGSLTIWNARADALAAEGQTRDLLNFVGSPLESGRAATNICGCPEPGSPVCFCKCPPAVFDSRIFELGGRINEFAQEVQALKEKAMKDKIGR